jgi:hypothetical protein
LRIFKNAWFHRFSHKEDIADDVLVEAVRRIKNGLVDADLGGGVLKQRIARPGRGKSKGYRTIILFRRDEKAFFVYGFSKGAQANISRNETVMFKKMAEHVLALSDSQLDELLAKGQFEEVRENDPKISE